MVLGLIDFLLGGRKKTKIPRTGQVVAPLNNVGGYDSSSNQQDGNNSNSIPDGVSNSTQNVVANQSLQFEDSQNQQVQQNNSQQVQQNSNQSQSGKKFSEILTKINEDIKNTNNKISELVGEIKTVQNDVSSMGHRVDEIEEQKKITDEKLQSIDVNMTKFLSLYELINNQYNPFVEQGLVAPKEVILADGNSEDKSQDSNNKPPLSFDDLNLKGSDNINSGKENLESSLLELDTLDIEEAAADAVPLTRLKNNTNSLVIILSWLEYLIKKVGIEETRNSLRYYTETLRWITPEVFFDLDKYLKGMKDNKSITGNESLTVRDHIVSLYFISKLNEKALDKKLTAAVLQIIKE